MELTAEAARLEQSRRRLKNWKRWGPYLSERAWGSVREDYSPDGTAWDYFPHDHARSRAYRWNEDGLAGICDRHQRICFAIALWNRPRPDPEGAPVRPHWQRREPRRGREGVLLLRRQHADALLHEIRLQVPAGAFPYADLVRRESPARIVVRRNTSWSTRASSTAIGTSTSRSNTPRRTQTTSWSAFMSAIAATSAPRLTCCRLSGSATPGRGRTRRRGPRWREQQGSTPPSCSMSPSTAAAGCTVTPFATPKARPGQRSCSPRTRRTRFGCSASSPPRLTRRTRSTPM